MLTYPITQERKLGHELNYLQIKHVYKYLFINVYFGLQFYLRKFI